ncbi:UDP-N-acetylglucosamine 1-carboxyvinyltransferase 1 [Collibacillus ludicampi]|uniref:UDP-N-acetylglucosamine 1-carboxyvinyltransferase n=1 Tax=Collibacillus ludicampi TaxID=2771369 RepID=A0AAV4LCX8_9BACL|nr:UDP-N-acetylglucosamine 1-carboxyvinyltransferase [Collibacillus ludicampi]GIM45685.1 UDP-N-acetylglucosamine 1-carboxyvinyltransferase 1 [Collibacillus ludicampi]
MAKYVIRGGNRLSGTVKIEGAKNAVLPILAASLLAGEGESVIEETPALTDVKTMSEVIQGLGAEVSKEDHAIRIQAANINSVEPSEALVRKMRASQWVMGSLLGRLGRARVAQPGGCAIGSRPIDQHLKGFQALGAEVETAYGFVEVRVPKGRKLRGTRIYLDIKSVGATINIMLAATLAEGTTIIENAAKEPEIVDTANYLNAMGAHVRGAGTDVIRIEGVETLRGATHAVIPDRITAGTYLIASAITGGDVYVEGAISDHLQALIAKLQEAGVKIEDDVSGIRVTGGPAMRPLEVKTLTHPGFPTDLQAQMMAFLTIAPGRSLVTETVFENRFMHAAELNRMGANIRTQGRTALIEGVDTLYGASVTASDLRAGAALIIAGLVAEGTTEVYGLHHVDRGYVDIEGKLRALGADIERVEED